ncbi:MAG: hypothetical protein A2487_05005 [Candidatus Raymondbacteria bacterium RifOxyC12_full_50_8]|uniref:Uncharacterized protein n=1 Tax=Candidatus Raymondbacteria bacterium RIFOXYD12_FULL_49_13 TaxID=1817890 RepID=A0A1F7FI69_UNCRA|nr:MAG: hypothetical protein A2248_22280 [Candidatus Raymondbacteria bacterium RIFOXYA2_FULL_49_16]OGJ94017.1 MAG: hypothetical protein A2350_19640 [Candidatus Raymondbacteria bacterium RifOxyB12_full_50_8]OGK00116.1 MAG: hypothetical protein A2487_05005 [Candidatus Raymondbacteria bacterium RifOxyC12_full_50_8]OGK06156.1 MAG: hypothetical protein A2519_22760 [Candidatus Raymondbacteria bacterium RIFOXYD12_FULL_49_13]OGP42834.1 MAG: hypothetical protein A2324_16125 [Candidatus Raymondbacteria b
MEQQNGIINPDIICQQALQVQLKAYKAKEAYDAVLKEYGDVVDLTVQTVNLMKNRILELENQVKEAKEKDNKEKKAA